jgi:hypothetical protein
MGVVTVRVPEKIKKEMTRYDVNWSEYLREAIRKRILDAKRREIAARMDRLRAKTKGKNVNLAQVVIEWRKKH